MSGPPRDWAWVQSHGTETATIAGAVLLVLVIAAIWRAARRASLASTLRSVAIPLVLLWEAQGLYGLALRLGFDRDFAYGGAAVAAAVIAALGAFAHEHFGRTGGREGGGNLGPCGRWMWYVATPMGCIVAATAPTLSGAGLRVILPLLSVLLFRAAYVPDEPAGHKAKQGSWRITPRRVAVTLGLIDPADTDLTAVHEERTVRLLTRHAAGYHRGARWLRGWHGWRFERLALMAGDEMIDEARRRVRRVHTGLASTAPDAVAGSLAVTVAAASATPVATSIAAPIAAPVAAPSRGATGDVPRAGSGDGNGAPVAQSPPGAVARVRRKGCAAAGDDEIRAAIRELREDDPDLTAYKIGKELKGSKGTIGDRRAARLLAEVQAERPNLSAVK